MKTIRYTVPIFVMLCVTGAALADVGHDARKELQAMEGMDHSDVQERTSATEGRMPEAAKMKMDDQGSAAGAHWMAPAEAARRGNPIPANSASRERGRKLFEANCVSCHGPTGRGNGPIAARLETLPADLAAMAGQHPDGDFAWKIAEGRGAMPSWKGILKENQIWDLVNYVQSLAPGKDKTHDHAHSH